MITLLPRILKWTEILGIVLAVAGYVFKILHLAAADQMLMIGLNTLATTYFLFGFTVPPQVVDDGKPKGFADLMPTILRKLLYIGLAVFLVGFLFAILHLEGARQMLMIGLGTLVGGVLLSMVLILGNRDRMTLLKDPLIRAVVFLLIFLVSYLR